jgi:predicted DNA-binding protein
MPEDYSEPCRRSNWSVSWPYSTVAPEVSPATCGVRVSGETYSRLNLLEIRVSRTSIPINEATKERLDKLKRDDETWDEFLRRVTAEDEPIQQGDLSSEALDAIEENVRKSRESF